MTTNHHQDDTDQLLRLAAAGDTSAATRLLDRHRDRLRNLIALRLDTRLSARVDPSDVIQEALVDANAQLTRFANERPLPFYPWLRQVALSRLAQVHRFHLHTQRRAVDREVDKLETMDNSGAELARHFASNLPSPSQQARENEKRRSLDDAIRKLRPTDREVLVLRYVEQLSASDAAAVMRMTPNTFAQRHLRAVRRLRTLVDSLEEDR